MTHDLKTFKNENAPYRQRPAALTNLLKLFYPKFNKALRYECVFRFYLLPDNLIPLTKKSRPTKRELIYERAMWKK